MSCGAPIPSPPRGFYLNEGKCDMNARPISVACCALLVAVLAACSPAPRVDDPQRSTATTETPIHAWVTRVVSCLHDAGWTGVSIAATGDGFENDSLPADQRSSFRTSTRECELKAGPQPNTEPMTEDGARSQYAALIQSKACLEKLGYSISDPPSETKFVDDYLGSSQSRV